MAIQSGLTDSFMQELFTATHNFSVHTFKWALYTNAANIGPTTTAYTATGEVVGTGYVAGGTNATGVAVAFAADTVYLDFSDPSWPGATLTARGAMLYNSSAGNKSVAVLDFGADRSWVAQTATIILPAAAPTSALIRWKRGA